jgi:hypothetical protein
LPKFPQPPAVETLRQIQPEPRRLPAGTHLWRVYFRGGATPGRWDLFRDFGPTSALKLTLRQAAASLSYLMI